MTRLRGKVVRWDRLKAAQQAAEIQRLLDTGVPPNSWQREFIEAFDQAYRRHDMAELQLAYRGAKSTGWGQFLVLE